MPTTWRPAPPPEGDTARLLALRNYAILDTLPEQAYDDITLLAAQLCTAPIALVSLVDAERQWFKAKIGIEQLEMPRYIAFCAHAILEPNELLVVEDARADARFAGNVLVRQSPFIRFYAGAPLVTSGGHALGTVCVMDRVPRILTASQLEALQALSRQVVAHLELRRSVEELKRSQELMETSQRKLKHYQRRLRDANAQLHQQSFTDVLTGVFNRRAFGLHLAKAVADAAAADQAISLMMLDVDRFKAFNDDFGHMAGDRVLQGVAQAIQASVRKNDIVARYGGEEFAVILPEVEAPEAQVMAERVCAAVRQNRWRLRTVTVSAGVASRDADRATGEELLAAADGALYEAKARGRDQAVMSTSPSPAPFAGPTV